MSLDLRTGMKLGSKISGCGTPAPAFGWGISPYLSSPTDFPEKKAQGAQNQLGVFLGRRSGIVTFLFVGFSSRVKTLQQANGRTGSVWRMGIGIALLLFECLQQGAQVKMMNVVGNTSGRFEPVRENDGCSGAAQIDQGHRAGPEGGIGDMLQTRQDFGPGTFGDVILDEFGQRAKV